MSGGVNVVAHNLQGMFSSRQLGIVAGKKAKSTEKLASGYKINRAADNAAGLAISEKMRRQIRGLTQGTQNTQDGISMCQIADGALSEVSEMLHRLTELSVQSANGTYTAKDRQAIQSEVNEIVKEINRISETTTFNEQKIFASNEPESSTPVLSNYEIARKELMDAAYRTVDADVVLNDGGVISKDDANAIVHLLSNVAIIGKGYEIYEKVSGNYPDNYKFKMQEVEDHIVENRLKILQNTHSLYSYGESASYTSGMEMVETSLKDQLNHYASTGTFTYQIENTVFDGYASALSYSRTGVSAVGYYIGSGLFFTDTLMYNTGRTSTYPYELQIAKASGEFITGIDLILQKNGINSGKIHDDIQDSLQIGWGGEIRLAEGDSGIDMATKLYMTIVGIEDDSEDADSDYNEFWIQSGSEAGDGMFVRFGAMDASVLGIDGLNVSTENRARKSISAVKNGLLKLSSIRSEIGAQQNRLEHTVNHQNNTVENTQAAESRIRNTDMAKEMVTFSASDIIQQAGQAMLTQANQSNQGVLSLLQ